MEPAKVDTDNPPTISFDSWRFYADRNSVVSKTDDWLNPGFADGTWRTASNEPWNLQFEDLQDYGGVGLYRSRPFVLPAAWKNKRLTINMDGLLGYCWSSFDLYINGQKIDAMLRPHRKVDVTDKLRNDGNVVCIKLTGKKTGGDNPLSGLLGAIWLQPELALAPTISLLGEWQAVQGDWVTSETVTLPGIERQLTDDGRLKEGVTPVKANHLVRDVEIPAAWRGRNVYLHVVSPHMHGDVGAKGLTGGMLMINGHAVPFDSRPNTPLDQMLNVTPYLTFGQPNRIELWPRDPARGSMTEENLVVTDLVLGCAEE